MSLRINVILNSPFANVARKSGLLATEDSSKSERDRLLEELKLYKRKNKQLKKFTYEKDAKTKARFTYL